jgi:uncharacterized protein (TIRG00374 family)
MNKQQILTDQKLSKANLSLRNSLIYSVILFVLVGGLVIAAPGLRGVWDQIGQMEKIWIIVAVACRLISCLGYVVAFLQVFVGTPKFFGSGVALSELAFGNAVSLGGAGGLVVGGWLMVERGAKPKTVAQRSAVLFLLTSAINIITLIAVSLGLLFRILPGPKNIELSLLPAIFSVAVFLFFMFLPKFVDRLTAKLKPGRITKFLNQSATAVRDTGSLLLPIDWHIIGAIAYLWGDIGALIACFAALGHIPPFAAIVLAYQLGYLADVIPIPGSVGILDASFVGLMVIYGINATNATAATLVYHTITVWIPAVLGTSAYILVKRTKDHPINLNKLIRFIHSANDNLKA